MSMQLDAYTFVLLDKVHRYCPYLIKACLVTGTAILVAAMAEPRFCIIYQHSPSPVAYARLPNRTTFSLTILYVKINFPLILARAFATANCCRLPLLGTPCSVTSIKRGKENSKKYVPPVMSH
ncbi:hypothetical protein XELAEV_18018444mg [Xenopus laevis]|uniref:Uncharacterized protein n=1 Tax=Xenopus laevis TaxID=8355 RepID=A0A974DF03_XENLA|nr:hypothetical protein XELAEV_18018444mg [Xenopus laevis]